MLQRAMNRLPNSLRISLLGWTKNPSWAAYRDTMQELQRLFRPLGGPGALVATLEDGTVVTAQARALSLVPSPEDVTPTKRLGVELEAVEPPYWLGPDVTDGPRAIAASPTDFTLTHPGTEQAHRIVYTLAGPMHEPAGAQSHQQRVRGVAGQRGRRPVAVIDCLNYTARLAGANVVGNVRHSGARQWAVLLPGPNAMRVTRSGGTGTLSTVFQPPYL